MGVRGGGERERKRRANVLFIFVFSLNSFSLISLPNPLCVCVCVCSCVFTYVRVCFARVCVNISSFLLVTRPLRSQHAGYSVEERFYFAAIEEGETLTLSLPDTSGEWSS